jgi:hypothetical protein
VGTGRDPLILPIEMVQGFASGFDQMNFFPYAELYPI